MLRYYFLWFPWHPQTSQDGLKRNCQQLVLYCNSISPTSFACKRIRNCFVYISITSFFSHRDVLVFSQFTVKMFLILRKLLGLTQQLWFRRKQDNFTEFGLVSGGSFGISRRLTVDPFFSRVISIDETFNAVVLKENKLLRLLHSRMHRLQTQKLVLFQFTFAND